MHVIYVMLSEVICLIKEYFVICCGKKWQSGGMPNKGPFILFIYFIPL